VTIASYVNAIRLGAAFTPANPLIGAYIGGLGKYLLDTITW
jgi:hypothetical protein